jgi:hypothetical protein
VSGAHGVLFLELLHLLSRVVGLSCVVVALPSLEPHWSVDRVAKTLRIVHFVRTSITRGVSGQELATSGLFRKRADGTRCFLTPRPSPHSVYGMFLGSRPQAEHAAGRRGQCGS